MAEKKKAVIMRVSVAGSPDLAARGRYELSEKLADELISIGYADEAAPVVRRGRRPAAGAAAGQDDEQADAEGAEGSDDADGDDAAAGAAAGQE